MLRQLVEDKLKEDLTFRERRNKDLGIVDLLIDRWGLRNQIDEGVLSKDRILAMVQDYASMDRMWRMILREDENLRGTDYDDKDKLEAETMQSLGYRGPTDTSPIVAAEPERQVELL